MLKIYTVEQAELWDSTVKSFEKHDIYYLNGYAKSFQIQGDGEPLLFFYEKDGIKAINVQMKRDIAKCPKFEGMLPENTYFDFSTPYGYGGWLIEGDGDTADLFSQYENWCRENGIVSEFVRFSPTLNNAERVKDFYSPVYLRNTLATNLADYIDPVQSEFSKGCRKKIRQILKKGVSYRVTKSPECIDCFQSIYYSTMDRDNADDFYYFTSEYFKTVHSLLNDNLIFVEALFEGKTVAAGLYFVSNGIIHAHLSGTLSEYLNISPAYMVKYATAQWGKENGCRLVHYGGGTDSSPDNGLYRFKKKFSQNTELPFYIGKKIFDSEKYDELCRMRGNENTGYFPAYRQ